MSVQVPIEAGSQGGGRGRRRGPALAVLALLVTVLTAVGLASAGVRSGTSSNAPAKGGTLTLLGQSDIFNLDTTSGYYTVDNILERAFTRQLVSYPNARVVPRADPAQARHRDRRADEGERRHQPDGKTYTLHIKPGVKWDTTPGATGDRGRLRARVQDALQPGLADRRAGLLREHDRRHEGVLRRASPR